MDNINLVKTLRKLSATLKKTAASLSSIGTRPTISTTGIDKVAFATEDRSFKINVQEVLGC